MKPNNASPKRFVIYARCSTDDQSKGEYTTLDAQVHHCQCFLEAKGYELARVVRDDGYSGKDLNRPGIQSILHEVGKKNEKTFDGIVFLRLDRLSRNMRDLWAIVDLFQQHNVEFQCVQESIESVTPQGRFFMNMLGSLASYEREQIGQRVKASALARIRQGRRVGGILPYGYKFVPDGAPLPDGTQPRKAIIDEAVAPKIILVWRLATQNKSIRTIARELDRIGLKTPKGKPWRVQSVLGILRNRFYCGDVKWNDEIHPGKHEALVDRKLWEKANRMISANIPGHRFSPKPKTYIYLLEGLLKCSECGSYFITKHCHGHTSNPFYYYVCGRKNQGLGCEADAISATSFDKAMIEFFRNSSKDQRMIIDAIGTAIEEARAKLGEADKNVREVEAKIESLRAQANQLLDSILKGDVPKGPTSKERLQKLEDKITELELRRDKLEAQRKAAQISSESADFIHSNIVYIMSRFDEAEPAIQKRFFRTLIKEIIVQKDRLEISMFLGKSFEQNLPHTTEEPKEKRPATDHNGEALLTTQALGLPKCQEMLPG
ncbi:MAG: hypothetical protein COV74_04990 [Candidatus Omnitrophica bacterium CG11_big_fil_rev_8_21_14_0_20_45_26]|uniref:Recombinase family protein n=1 Tax=Candidatus Abzuiibacterium crystallinum TaxID=1974748 RepID=A0A2H0LPX2_9BACT|nr:MAG: hypothetical protein COV74_04990 [Candidatus Omnitrophica bacterium CG11_big_fil_rev_8_21_14_0_20_45_26]PIW63617.1 MAG: hypothetical protein COW12_09905 [Candidatus Omnitrophica bacterium CG12_big_fil_rev_8_21_14_0_65_45_16]